MSSKISLALLACLFWPGESVVFDPSQYNFQMPTYSQDWLYSTPTTTSNVNPINKVVGNNNNLQGLQNLI